MVVIRLARIGKKKQAFYRIVAADSKKPVKAKFIEILGWYNPHSKEFNIKEDRVRDWLDKGAQPSNTVAKLLKNAGLKLPEWVKITKKNKKAKAEKPEVEKGNKAVSAEAENDKPEETKSPDSAESETENPTEVKIEQPAAEETAVEE